MLVYSELENDIFESITLGEFRGKLLAKIRPEKKSLFEFRDIRGLRRLTKLRVKFSPLNEHRFRHSFESVNPICVCNSGIEKNEHFLLHCSIYGQMRNDLFD